MLIKTQQSTVNKSILSNLICQIMIVSIRHIKHLIKEIVVIKFHSLWFCSLKKYFVRSF